MLLTDQCSSIAADIPRTMVKLSAFSFSGLLRVNHATLPASPLLSSVISWGGGMADHKGGGKFWYLCDIPQARLRSGMDTPLNRKKNKVAG